MNIKTKKILIDGFNLIYKFPELEEKMRRNDLEGAMKGLTAQVSQFAKKHGKLCTIIYDGKKKEGVNVESETSGGIRIIYSINCTADYVIMQAIKNDKEPKMTTVVTSDRGIIGYLKKFGTPVISSDDFSEIIGQCEAEIADETENKPVDVNLTADEMHYWEDIFIKRKNGK